MLSKKRQKNIIEKIVLESFDGKGRLKEKFVRYNIGLLKRLPLSQAISALSLYSKRLKREILKTTLKIITSCPLSVKEENRIAKAAAKNFTINKIEIILDASLLGGIRLKIGDTVFDGSLQNKIGQIKELIYG